MNFDTVNAIVGTMGGMRYFPADSAARLGIVEMMGDLTDDEDQVRWLVKEVRTRFAEWPGEFALRSIFTARFRPKDGIAHSICSCGCGQATAFQLATNQAWPPQIAAPDPKLLTSGEKISRDDGAADAVHIAVKLKELGNPLSGPATAAEIAAAPEWLRELEGYR